MNNTYRLALYAFCLSILNSAAASSDIQMDFLNTLKTQCGATYRGVVNFPAEPGEDFKDKVLQAKVDLCFENEIRIPFWVGENKSRTWVIKRTEGGLELKHDHRREDGSADEITMYGGTTETTGTAFSQSFPADEYTAQLIPDAATNEWFLSLSQDKTTMTYYLERHGKPRFKAILKLQDDDQTDVVNK